MGGICYRIVGGCYYEFTLGVSMCAHVFAGGAN